MKTVRFLFNDDMARAIVQGRKTVTRRPVGGIDGYGVAPCHFSSTGFASVDDNGAGCCICSREVRSPCATGDVLIGRECFRFVDFSHIDGVWTHGVEYRAGGFGEYRHGGEELMNERIGWRPSIHMPDWAARIRRRVLGVTVERVQDITELDAVREGFSVGEEYEVFGASTRFCAVWNSAYAAKGLGWDVNPWVWRIEFGAENVREASDGR